MSAASNLFVGTQPRLIFAARSGDVWFGGNEKLQLLHEGKWHDLLLLSVTADEFRAWMKDHGDRPLHEAAAQSRT